jgi:hypothetical protein
MSENSQSGGTGNTLSTDDLRALLLRLASTPSPGTDNDLVDQLEALERLKSAACAAQARLAHDLIALRPVTRPGTTASTVIREVSLARRESPYTAGTKVR